MPVKLSIEQKLFDKFVIQRTIQSCIVEQNFWRVFFFFFFKRKINCWELWIQWKWKVKVKVARSCLTLCDPMDYTVQGILKARLLEWVAFPFSRGSSQPRDGTQVSCIAGGFFTSWATRETQENWSWIHSLCYYLQMDVLLCYIYYFKIKISLANNSDSILLLPQRFKRWKTELVF